MPDGLTIEPLLYVLELTLEWIHNGGNQARRLPEEDEIHSVRSAPCRRTSRYLELPTWQSISDQARVPRR